MRVQMRFAPACVAAVEDVAVGMRVHRPDVHVETELLFCAKKVIIILEKTA